MGVSEIQQLSELPDYLMPSPGADGIWGSVGGIALRDSLSRGSVDGVMDLLRSMNTDGLAKALREAGFLVNESEILQGRGAVFASVQSDLEAALRSRMDGFTVRITRDQLGLANEPRRETFAAKPNPAPYVEPEFFAGEFDGDKHAAFMIEGVLRSHSINVDLLGECEVSDRNSLLLVAGQALKKGIHGFGFDGLSGKYQVPLSMAAIVELHRGAAQAVATESARAGLAAWAVGDKVTDLSDLVPDSLQRLLHSSLSLAGAQVIVNVIEGGGVARHAGEIGVHRITSLLAAQGLDVNAPTVHEKAAELGLTVKEPDRMRGQYFGTVVAQDHRASLVKFTRSDAIELAFADLAVGQKRPKMGDALRLGFRAGALTVSQAERPGSEIGAR